MTSRVKIVVHVPLEAADAVRRAIGGAGAGMIGEYSYCSFSVLGTGRYIPNSGAKPYIGEPGVPSETPEERVEVTCDRAAAKQVIAAIRAPTPMKNRRMIYINYWTRRNYERTRTNHF